MPPVNDSGPTQRARPIPVRLVADACKRHHVEANLTTAAPAGTSTFRSRSGAGALIHPKVNVPFGTSRSLRGHDATGSAVGTRDGVARVTVTGADRALHRARLRTVREL